MTGEPRIIVSGLHHAFRRNSARIEILHDVNLTVHAGEIVALFGPSGSGKTTLLNLIGGIEPVQQGHILIDGQDLAVMTPRQRTHMRRYIFGYVFQSYALLPHFTAAENIELAQRLIKTPYRQRKAQTEKLLQVVDLQEWASHTPYQLSGGQRQRINIARALATNPRIMLADEPTSGLDKHLAQQILGLFRQYAENHKTTFVIASHDLQIQAFVDRIYNLTLIASEQ